MRAAITWSYELLGPAEQALLARLSVFAGQFRLAASEAVCGFSPLDPGSVLPALTGLTEKSLAVHAGAGYHLPETVRQFAAERLVDLGAEMDARARHADFYLDLAEAGRAEAGDLDNLRAALDWAQRCDAGRHLRLASALVPLWLAQGALKDARTHVRAALDQADEIDPARPAALARLAAVERALEQAADIAALRAALSAAGGSDLEMEIVAAGAAALAGGELAAAVRCFRRPLRERIPSTIALSGLAVVAARHRDHERAMRLDGAARAELDRIGLHLTSWPVDESERALGHSAVRELRARGARMSFAEAVELAAGESRPGDLSERELEVARLVAEGLTNRQIGARLHLSVRTVEGHVEHLRQKLGFGTRAKVAAWIAENR